MFLIHNVVFLQMENKCIKNLLKFCKYFLLSKTGKNALKYNFPFKI